MPTITKALRRRASAGLMVGLIILQLTLYLQAKQETIIQLEGERDLRLAMQGMLDSTDRGYAVLDRSGKVIYWNAGLERMTGWSFEDMRGKTLEPVMPDDETWQHHQVAYLEIMEDEQRNKKKTRIISCVMKHKTSGALLKVSASVWTVETPNNRVFANAMIDEQRDIVEVGDHS